MMTLAQIGEQYLENHKRIMNRIHALRAELPTVRGDAKRKCEIGRSGS